VIDVGPIGQQHVGEGASSLVSAVRLEDDFFSKHQRGCRLLGLMAVRLALLRAVDAAQTDAFRVSVVEDFEGIAVEDPREEKGDRLLIRSVAWPSVWAKRRVETGNPYERRESVK
jgi:hypothetical protein